MHLHLPSTWGVILLFFRLVSAVPYYAVALEETVEERDLDNTTSGYNSTLGTGLPAFPLARNTITNLNAFLDLILSVPESVLEKGDTEISSFWTNVGSCMDENGQGLESELTDLAATISSFVSGYDSGRGPAHAGELKFVKRAISPVRVPLCLPSLPTSLPIPPAATTSLDNAAVTSTSLVTDIPSPSTSLTVTTAVTSSEDALSPILAVGLPSLPTVLPGEVDTTSPQVAGHVTPVLATGLPSLPTSLPVPISASSTSLEASASITPILAAFIPGLPIGDSISPLLATGLGTLPTTLPVPVTFTSLQAASHISPVPATGLSGLPQSLPISPTVTVVAEGSGATISPIPARDLSSPPQPLGPIVKRQETNKHDVTFAALLSRITTLQTCMGNTKNDSTGFDAARCASGLAELKTLRTSLLTIRRSVSAAGGVRRVLANLRSGESVEEVAADSLGVLEEALGISGEVGSCAFLA